MNNLFDKIKDDICEGVTSNEDVICITLSLSNSGADVSINKNDSNMFLTNEMLSEMSAENLIDLIKQL